MGVILYELFTGTPPFYTTSIYSLVKKIVREPPRFPPEMPDGLRSFLSGLLDKDPDRRLSWPDLLDHPFLEGMPGKSIAKNSRKTWSDGNALGWDSNPSEEFLFDSKKANSSEKDLSNSSSLSRQLSEGDKSSNTQKDGSESTVSILKNKGNDIPVPSASEIHPIRPGQKLEQKRANSIPKAIPLPRKNSDNSFGCSPSKPGYEPVFVDPPQFSRQASPSRYTIKSGGSNCSTEGLLAQADADPAALGILVDALRRIERNANVVNSLWEDEKFLEYLSNALSVPSGKSSLLRWSKQQETAASVRLLEPLLKSTGNAEVSERYKNLVKISTIAAQKLLECGSKLVCPVAIALSSANLEGSEESVVSFFCEMISTRGSWDISETGCLSLTVICASAQNIMFQENVKSTQLSSAVLLIDATIKKKAAGKLCRCVEDALDASRKSSKSVVSAAVQAITSLLPGGDAVILDKTFVQRDESIKKPHFPCALLAQTPLLKSWNPNLGDSSILRLWHQAILALLASQTVMHVFLNFLDTSLETETATMGHINIEKLLRSFYRLLKIEPRLGSVFVNGGLIEHLIGMIVANRSENDGTNLALLLLVLSDTLPLASQIVTVSSNKSKSLGIDFARQIVDRLGAEKLARLFQPSLIGAPKNAILSATSAMALASLIFLAMENENSILSMIRNRTQSKSGSSFLRLNSKDLASSSLRSFCKLVVPDATLPILRRILMFPAVTSSSYHPFHLLEGSPCVTGLLDGVVYLTAALANVDSNRMINAGLGKAALSLLCSLPHPVSSDYAAPGNELSPWGLIALLESIRFIVENEPDAVDLLAAEEHSVPALLATLHPDFLTALEACVDAYGCAPPEFGRKYAAAVRYSSTAILQASFSHHTAKAESSSRIVQQSLLSARGSIPALVSCLAAILGNNIPTHNKLEAACLPACVHLLARLSVANQESSSVSEEFAAAGGLSPSILSLILEPSNNTSVLTSGLLIISQLARSAASPDIQKMFVESQLVPLMPALLRSSDPTVRARAANLLGNLCRHSDALYVDLKQYKVIPHLIDLCTDPDRSTRKFACFAIGNAGFHSSLLYPLLRPAVIPLVHLLKDEEDRTRANAAGALGNLLRNSSELVPDVLSAGALKGLMDLISFGSKTNEGVVKLASSVQISLFSLGNMAAHYDCATALVGMDVEHALKEVEDAPGCDPITKKYVARVRLKLSNHSGKKFQGRVPPQQTPLRLYDC